VLPTTFALSQNYPNPFNPNTEIKYQLPKDSRVVLSIYNVMGQEVVTLVDAGLKAGYYTATWNARDARGTEVSAGIYFCRLQAGEFSQTRKMVLIK
jgi:flagellar hook assembly protein FlgD